MDESTVSAGALRALLKVVPKHDTRYYLNGAYFDTTARRLVATDGHIMLIIKSSMFDPGVAPFIVPRDTLAAAVKLTAKSRPNLFVNVTGTAPARIVEFTNGSDRVSAPEIDGKFPEYARVTPAKPSGESATFSVVLQAQLVGAMREFTGQWLEIPALFMNGPGAGLLVSSNPDVLGVIMPVREGDPETIDAWRVATIANLGL